MLSVLDTGIFCRTVAGFCSGCESRRGCKKQLLWDGNDKPSAYLSGLGESTLVHSYWCWRGTTKFSGGSVTNRSLAHRGSVALAPSTCSEGQLDFLPDKTFQQDWVAAGPGSVSAILGLSAGHGSVIKHSLFFWVSMGCFVELFLCGVTYSRFMLGFVTLQGEVWQTHFFHYQY